MPDGSLTFLAFVVYVAWFLEVFVPRVFLLLYLFFDLFYCLRV